MSGVIIDGVQWERCNDCSEWVRYSPRCNLGYLKPNAQHPHGRDLCAKCVDAGIRFGKYDFDNIVPAETWRVYEVTS